MAAVKMNREQFEKALAGDKPVLVDFWAPWCVYCRKISDAYDRIAEQYGEEIVVAKVNIDEEEALAIQEKIEIIPTLVLYKDGQALGSIVAPESGAAIEGFIGETVPKKEQEKDPHVHDMVIIGGGPGGYTAALYAARAGLDTLVVEMLSAGGQMAQTHQVDNYPGFEEGVDGYELAQKMQRQAERFGAKTLYAQVTDVELTENVKTVVAGEQTLRAKTVVIATGANPRELGLENERELVGKGVAYCAACDGMFYKGKTVIVVGGGNSAAADALLLSRVAKKVYLVHRRDTLRATKIYHEPLMQADNVELVFDSEVVQLLAGERLTGALIRNVHNGEVTQIHAEGLFVSVGRKPASHLFAGQAETDETGYIVADETTKTNLPGVYAVGDVRVKRLRQVVTAVADGAAAVHEAEEYLAALKG